MRLLALTGAPGIGKTRLALQVATELLDTFEDGVFLVELAPISDPDLLPDTIARTLGVKAEGAQPLEDPLLNAVCERLMGSVRRECLDHMLILGEKHLHRVGKEYVQYYNRSRPHQGISQTIPELAELALAHQRARVARRLRKSSLSAEMP